MARQLGKPLREIDSSVVLSGPQCAEAMQYQAWLTTQREPGQVGFCIMHPGSWAEGREAGAVASWVMAFRELGHPPLWSAMRIFHQKQ